MLEWMLFAWVTIRLWCVVIWGANEAYEPRIHSSNDYNSYREGKKKWINGCVGTK